MCPAAASASLSRSSRWCPTAEQVTLLEQMYKGGLRNPSACQIHQITAHLSNFGKVQGKNVFYWFQNHKARDKQRLKKKLLLKQHHQSCYYYASLPSQRPVSRISYTGLNISTCQGSETANAAALSVCESNQMNVSRDHWAKKRVVVVRDTPGNSVQPLCQGRPRLQTLDLFPVAAADLKHHREAETKVSLCFDGVAAASGSLEFGWKPTMLSLCVHGN